MGATLRGNIQIDVTTAGGVKKIYGVKDATLKIGNTREEDVDFDTDGSTITGLDVQISGNANLKTASEREAIDWMEDQVLALNDFPIKFISKSRGIQYELDVSVELNFNEAAKQKGSVAFTMYPTNVNAMVKSAYSA